MIKNIHLKYFDFFAGIGGFRLAANTISSSKFELNHVGFCEIDPIATKFYKNSLNQCDNLQYVKDINDIEMKKNHDGVKLDKFDLMLAGFPCQSFSNVGYRKGLDDPRGRLFYNILNILDSYSPNFFILENVQKISTIKLGYLLDEMSFALENIGDKYHLHLWDLNAINYGLPQNRRRLFFCGVRKKYRNKKKLSPPKQIELKNTKYPTTWHLLERKMDVDHLIPKKTRNTVLYKNKKWMGNVKIDNHIARPITATMAKWHRANQDNYFSETYINALNPNPCERPIIDLDKERIRRITPLEGFRLQGFPDNFEVIREKLDISYSAGYRLIGNAVPVNLAKCVIEHFLESYIKE